MNREAIESFIDEIRDILPRMRRAFAIVHAWPDDHAARQEAHRLTHTIKGTAALVGVHTLSEIVNYQEELLEQLVAGRRSMDDRLRDTLERMTDLIESYSSGLLKGPVPEQQLLEEAIELCQRHSMDELCAGELLSPNHEHGDAQPSVIDSIEQESSDCGSIPLSQSPDCDEGFHLAAMETLHEMSERLDIYRRDLTRWDLLEAVGHLMRSLRQAGESVGWADFTQLLHRADALLQRLIDRSVPPAEAAADCLQACVDALEQRLDQELDDAILQQLFERIDEVCDTESPKCLAEDSSARPLGDGENGEATFCRPGNSPADEFGAGTETHDPTSATSVELDDRDQLSEEMLSVFTEEADDHLRLIYSALAVLKENAGQMTAIQDIRRSAHTIKGAAGSVGLRLVSKLSHRMEDLLDSLFSSQQPVNASTVQLLYDTTDALQDLVRGNFTSDEIQNTIAELYNKYDFLLSGANCPEEALPGADESLLIDRQEPMPIPLEIVPEAAVESPADVVSESDDEVVPIKSAPANVISVNGVLPTLTAWDRLAEPIKALPARNQDEMARQSGHKKPLESLRVPLAKIDFLVRNVGDLLINRSAFEQRMSDFGRCLEELRSAVMRIRNVSHDLDVKYGVEALRGRQRVWGDGASLFPGGLRLEGHSHDEFDVLEMDRYTEFHLLSRSLAETTTDIGTVDQELRSLMADFDQLLDQQGRLARDTQDRLMRIRLLPFSTLAERLHRTVRVIAAEQQKNVVFQFLGGDTEIDKRVLEELADPLMHLLRNAVDHGVEDSAARQAAGKPEQATIRVHAFQQWTQVVIRIADDGRGLNCEAIRETAVRHGLVTASEASTRSDDELSSFIFLPGFSTASKVSEVSGRGVGMDIVRDRIQQLNGTIRIDSPPGQGTTLTIRLPMTLAVTRAMLLIASQETFAIPMRSVVRVLRLERHEIEELGTSPVIRLGEETLPFLFLAERLGLQQPPEKTSKTVPALVLSDGDRKVVIGVDKVFPGRDIVVKTLGTHLRKVRGLIGATLLGDGSVVPILDAADLVSAKNQTNSAIRGPHRPIRQNQSSTIMVVDDSVSVRRVMLKLLNNSGWQALEAKDGLDALEQLQSSERRPDLFLVDIEMPRIDGYELLKSLRSRSEFRETPIVMVTSRAGDKHRLKAMRLGATDYVVKPYQDEDLLGRIRDLLAVPQEAVLV